MTNHFVDCHEAQHQDQGQPEHQCEQCLSLSHATDGDIAPLLQVAAFAASYLLIARLVAFNTTTQLFSYSVRAPPYYASV